MGRGAASIIALAHFAIQQSSHLYKSTYKLGKQSDKDFILSHSTHMGDAIDSSIIAYFDFRKSNYHRILGGFHVDLP